MTMYHVHIGLLAELQVLQGKGSTIRYVTIKFPNNKIIRRSAKLWLLEQSATTSHTTENLNKPGKLTVVFDVTAYFSDMCLNDHLFKGPDLLNNQLGML